MATKKKTQKQSESKSAQESKRNQEPETVQITFRPQFSAAQEKVIFLRELQTEVIGNSAQKRYVNTIEGLPQVFRVRRDEIVTITKDQFLALYKMGYIDTPETLKAKMQEQASIGTQSGVDPKDHRSAESLAHLYEDKLIRIA